MAIVVTSVLGGDSVSGSRTTIDDNFSIVADEINSIETYLDPNAATLDNLNSIHGLTLAVGPTGNYSLQITSTTFNINTSVVFTSPTSLITINGLVNQNSFGLLDETLFPGGTVTITPSTGFRNYVVKANSTSDFTILVQDTGSPGIELSFFVEQIGTGRILIKAASGAVFVLDTVNTQIGLNGIGSTVTIKLVTDSSSNGSYYITGSNNITLVP